MTVMKYSQDSKSNENVADSIGASSLKQTSSSFCQSDSDTGKVQEIQNLDLTDTGKPFDNKGNSAINRHEIEIQAVTDYIDALIVSMESMKRDLVNVKSHVEKYRADCNKQRLNCKTKELEAILLKNENMCLREELDRLRHVGQRSESIDDSNSQSTYVSNLSMADIRINSVNSADSWNSDNGFLCRSKYHTLAPILKPKIYRRPQIANFTDSLNPLQDSGSGNRINTKQYGDMESQSWMCTENTSTICEAEYSMSVPNIELDYASSANTNCNNNETASSNKIV